MAVKKSSPLAWVGSVTAVFSLIAGVWGGWTFFSNQLAKRRALDQYLAAEAVQFRASDYDSAWKTLTQAASVDASSARIREAQQDVAMAWLENIHASGGQTFTSIVDKLEPSLTQGVAGSKNPQRQADLLAHIGWSYFLRRRESPSSPDPASAYRDALAKDPANPYAHAMWGHWILWNHQDLGKATEHFNAALASPRTNLRPYIRSLQLSALNNLQTPEGAAEIIRVTNAMRTEQSTLDPSWPHRILNLYWDHVVEPNENRNAFLTAIPPLEQLSTFDWILQQADASDRDSLTNSYIRSALLESAGRRDEALTGYRKLQTRIGSNPGTLLDDTRKAIARLTANK